MTEKKIVVVTGARRGLGYAVCQSLAKQDMHVILTASTLEKAQAATSSLAREGLEVEPAPLDVSRDKDVEVFFDQLKQNHGRIDVLINNAGRIFESGPSADFASSSIFNISPDMVAEAFNNNTLSAYRTIRHALPMMNQAGYGRIVNVSSGMGALNEMGGGFTAYRVSKTAMNAITRIAALEAKKGVKVNTVCPGWVRTDMGGPNAVRNIEEGIAGIVWADTLPEDGPSSGFFRDGKPIDW
ncbi:MAG: SDR family NAD(P)-dependent oxidoreductase [Myxococcota bacterium]